MGEERYVTQSEAAARCGCDYSTIKRHRQRGSFPGLRRRTDATGTYEIPVSDLVSAGLWDPAAAEPSATPERLAAELHEARLELERLRGQLEALTGALEDRRDEVAYLRRALDAAHVALGGARGMSAADVGVRPGRPLKGARWSRNGTFYGGLPAARGSGHRIEGGFALEEHREAWLTAGIAAINAGRAVPDPEQFRVALSARSTFDAVPMDKGIAIFDELAHGWAAEYYGDLRNAGPERERDVRTLIEKHLIPALGGPYSGRSGAGSEAARGLRAEARRRAGSTRSCSPSRSRATNNSGSPRRWSVVPSRSRRFDGRCGRRGFPVPGGTSTGGGVSPSAISSHRDCCAPGRSSRAMLASTAPTCFGSTAASSTGGAPTDGPSPTSQWV
jgi:hypothetical protein